MEYQLVEPSQENSPGSNSPVGAASPSRSVSSWRLVGIIGLILIGVGGLLFYEKSPLNLTSYLAGMEYDGRYASAWRSDLDHSDGDTRRVAVIAVGKMENNPAKTLSRLCQIMLEDDDRSISIEASFSLLKLKAENPEVIAALVRALRVENPWVRMNAALALGGLNKKAKEAIPVLSSAIKDPKNQEKLDGFVNSFEEAMVLAQAKITADSDAGVDIVCDALARAETRQAKISFMQAALMIGEPARLRALPLLEKLKADADQEVSDEAIYKMAVLKGEKAEPVTRPPTQRGNPKGGMSKGGPGGFPKGPDTTAPDKDGKSAEPGTQPSTGK